MDIKPIRTEEDYENALKEIERLFDAEPGTPEEDKLEVLAILVEAYEAEHYSIPLPDPIEAIEYHMERLGLTRKDLVKYIGSASRVSEILNRKRRLTMRMIRNLNTALDIPLDVLIQEYDLEPQKQETQPISTMIVKLVAQDSFYSNIEQRGSKTKDLFTRDAYRGKDWALIERIAQ